MSLPPLTERRRAATRQDISLSAAALFAERGVEGTTVADIAAMAGVSLRTFYRYFRTKEDAVAPLLAAGAQEWRRHLADAVAEPLDTAIETAIRAALDPMTDPVNAAPTGLTRRLLNALDTDADMAAVWHYVNGESETRLRPVLAQREQDSFTALELRLVAAAATTAIRVALEHWAGTDGARSPAVLAVECYRVFRGIPNPNR